MVQQGEQCSSSLLSVCGPKIFIVTGNVTEVYMQSKVTLHRLIRVSPPNAIGYPMQIVFKVMRYMYRIPEAGISWFIIYHKYHKDDHQLKP